MSNNGAKTFEERVEAAELTKSGRDIARYLLNNLFKVSYMTATSVANELGVSDVTVIRFARALGYAGYNDMQKDLQERMNDYIDHTQTLLAFPSAVLEKNMHDNPASSLVSLAGDKLIKNLNRMLDANNDQKFEHAAQMIRKSSRKVVMGLRGSAAAAYSFSARLNYMLNDVAYVIFDDPNSSYPLYNLSKDDCLIIFGFVNYPQGSIDAVSLARNRGAKIVSFTDSMVSPLACNADVTIICSVEGISFSSYTIPLLASEIVAANIANGVGEQAEIRNQDLVDNLRKRHYFSSK